MPRSHRPSSAARSDVPRDRLLRVAVEVFGRYGFEGTSTDMLVRAMGIGRAVAIALSLQALVMVPWGGLGPGPSLGAVLAGVPAQQAVALTAWPNAAWLIALTPVMWWLQSRAGVVVTGREKAMQALMLGVLALLLVALLALPARRRKGDDS